MSWSQADLGLPWAKCEGVRHPGEFTVVSYEPRTGKYQITSGRLRSALCGNPGRVGAEKSAG